MVDTVVAVQTGLGRVTGQSFQSKHMTVQSEVMGAKGLPKRVLGTGRTAEAEKSMLEDVGQV